MINRIRQFIRAYRAKLTSEDYSLISSVLTAEEIELFYSMAVFDQRHVLNVFKTAISLLNTEARYKNCNRKLLFKACLLHDIGRNKEEISIWGKVLPVLCSAPLKTDFVHWARRNLNHDNFFIRKIARWGNYYYLYRFHPLLGENLILKLKTASPEEENFYEELALLIRNHHCYNAAFASVELEILQLADNLN